jgi:hypothetical protein
MQDRIQINGIWYIREDLKPAPTIDDINDESGINQFRASISYLIKKG